MQEVWTCWRHGRSKKELNAVHKMLSVSTSEYRNSSETGSRVGQRRVGNKIEKKRRKEKGWEYNYTMHEGGYQVGLGHRRTYLNVY